MGKPYRSELEQLPTTYAWAVATDVRDFAAAIESCAVRSLLVTGSGGSLTAAQFASFVHGHSAGRIAKAVTPLELVSLSPAPGNLAVMLLSAGGRNSDIIIAFRRAVLWEPRDLIVICAEPNSPLSQIAASNRDANVFLVTPPSGKDGFLATNSLLAFSLTLHRAYREAMGVRCKLPSTLWELICPGMDGETFCVDLRVRLDRLWQQDHLVVIHGPSAQAAALDLESKFTEAALGTVQVADYRNFGHGRHHWLAKRGANSAVLALVTDDDRQLAQKTLALIPGHIPVEMINIPRSGPEAALALLASVLYVVGFAGEARGIDPGRPGVPSFGRRIYNLRALPPHTGGSSSELRAIERKTGRGLVRLSDRELRIWQSAYRSFVGKLRRTGFSGVVLDYDGTLCDGRDRYHGIGPDIAGEVQRLVEANLVVGVATGRGKSVRSDLQSKLPNELWSRVVIGYYNGGEVSLLIDCDSPDAISPPGGPFAELARILSEDEIISELAECTVRRSQVTIEPRSASAVDEVWDIVSDITQRNRGISCPVVRSSHSIDVLAPGVSKLEVVKRVRHLAGDTPDCAVLCIGDRGRWPGNDFGLLSEPFSLSVDEVSPDPKTCWNLVPPGVRGVSAALSYLRRLDLATSGRVRFR